LLLADGDVDAIKRAEAASLASSAALFMRAWLMMVSTPMVVLPVERSPMINSRWPRPMGIIASTAMMPVCTGWLTDLRLMMPGRFFRRDKRFAVDRAFAVDRLAEGVDDAAQQALPTGTWSSLPVVRTSWPSDAGVIAQDDGADFGFLQVQRQADDAVAEVQHLVEHGVGEALDLGHAVADFADGADVLAGDAGFKARNLGFNFLQQCTHSEI
jgi:hypothetical protein